jgi:CubicO group peptidase (beta-lactamase class C family)
VEESGNFSGLALTLTALLSVCGAPSTGASAPEGLAVAIDQAVMAQVEKGFSGVVLVVVGGEETLKKAYGELGGSVFDSGSRFRISSTAKQFESAGILRARDMGLLDLDDPISRFFSDVPEDKQAITVRQLLTHQSAAAILEAVAGKDYLAFVAEAFFEPLGLEGTGKGGPNTNVTIVSTPGPLPERLLTDYWGGQGMYSTADDLFRWTEALRKGEVLSPESTEELFRPAATISEGFGAMAWFGSQTESGEPRIFTRGNDDYGPNSLIYFYPDADTTIIVLTHAGNSPDGPSFSRAVHGLIEDILFPVSD